MGNNALSAARPARRAVGDAAAAALGVAIGAAGFVNIRDHPQSGGAGPAAQGAPPPLHGGNRELLLLAHLAATGSFFTAAALTYRHVHHAGAGGPGAGNRRMSGTLTFMLGAPVCALQFLVFAVQPAGDGGADPGDRARALGLAALRALPAAATLTFYLGMLLIVVGHIRAGGEGGGGVVAGDEPVPAPVGVLVKMAWAAAAALVCLCIMAVAF